MIECPNCGEGEKLRGVALDDVSREITCEHCGHQWTCGKATQAVAAPTGSRRSTRPSSASCGPRWDDDPVVATLNRESPNLVAPGTDSAPVSFVPSRERTWEVGDLPKTNRVFSYIVVHDTGFSPNPFGGLLTLACCKPRIRKVASVGDLIVGLSSRSKRIVYATQVAEVLSFEEYWADPRYCSRRPIVDSPQIVYRVGDNIYEPVEGGYHQLPSVHSRRDGSEDAWQKRRDLGGNHVLVCERFTYWGGSGPALPERLQFLAVGRGHRSNFSADQIDSVARWFAELPGGVLGAPTQWKPGDQSWRET